MDGPARGQPGFGAITLLKDRRRVEVHREVIVLVSREVEEDK